MSALAGTAARAGGMSKDEKFVIRRARFSNGTTSISAVLATTSSQRSSSKSHPVAALDRRIALLTWVQWLWLGRFEFGRTVRTVSRPQPRDIHSHDPRGMAFCIFGGLGGSIPTFEQIGLAAAIILFCLRMIQGLCLGGSYGGAIIDVAEHVSDERRGYYTGWLQTSPTLGIVLSLVIIIATRTYFGEAAFNAWAWRVPFLCSFLLVFVTLWMRANFEESPVYAEIKAKGQTSKNPWREAFLNPANFKYVVIATIVVLGEGVVWYSSQFWALFYLQTVSKVDTLTTPILWESGWSSGPRHSSSSAGCPTSSAANR